MAKAPRVPAKQIKERLEAAISQGSREPFQKILADGLSVKPKLKSWRNLANNNPEAYSRTLKNIAGLACITERTESLSVNLTGDVAQLANTLASRYGIEKGREMLRLHGLPESLIADNTTIEGELVESPTTDENLKETRNHA